MNVFDLFAKISLDTSGYEASLSSARSQASSFGDKLKGIIDNATRFVGESLKTAGRFAAEFVADSVRTGMDFDAAMSQVAATMGTTVSEIGELRDFAREMGANTKYSATEAAEALNYMALAGYDAETSMSMLPNVLNLASAGAFDLARASDMVTDTQTAFGISLERTTQLVDEMAKAASTGNTSVEQLGEAFLTVGGLAQELNGGFITLADGTKAEVDGIQELEIALTAMANAGIKSSEAGTHMRNMLLKLTSPTEDGAASFEELGVKVFDASGEMRSLNDIFTDLSESLGSMTQQKKLDAISKIFNTRDTASAEALLHAVGEDWNQIGAAILDAAGAAEQMAGEQLNNLAGDVTTFKSALEETKIVISDMVSPALRDFVQTGTAELRNMTEAFQSNGFRGLFTIIQLDIEQAQRHIGEKLPELKEKGGEIVDKIASGIEAQAGKIGEKATGLLTVLGTKLTDPEAFAKVSGYAKNVVDSFLSGLLSEKSMNSLGDSETGIPKLIDNIGDNIVTATDNLLDSAHTVITKFTGYLLDPQNKDTIKGSAEDILVALGDSFVKEAHVIHGHIVDLMSDIMVQMVGTFDADATAVEMLAKLGQAIIHHAGNIMNPGLMLGQYVIDTDEKNADMDAFYRSTYRGTYNDWQMLSAAEKATYAPGYTPPQEYYTTEGMITSGTLTGSALEAYRKARGYASGFDATRPAWISDTVVGESGEEVLLPLDSNTGWMDKFADKLGDRLGSGVVIQFGDIIVSGNENAGQKVMQEIDRALRSMQIFENRGIGGAIV